MSYKAKIIINKDVENIYNVFIPELKDSEHERFKFSIQKKHEKLIFDIDAKDAVALRTVLNSLARLLIIYEKVKRFVENARN